MAKATFTLDAGSCLQNSKYRILSVLGQGGFGITYEAEQVALRRKVAIKEFFMKEYCERDETTCHVTLGTSSGSRDLVERFRVKFVKEARTIATLNHPHIVKIIDVFEENGTAYYVMLYLEGGSLADLCKDGRRLPEADARHYTRQIASALDYLHHRAEPMNHLDVKPTNVLLDENGDAVLIDFGISKRYDEKGGQTSSTPVGISHGYSPLEQYKDGGVKEFSPATDIYSLGATLYTLLTGKVPPSASEVNEDGIPPFPTTVSKNLKDAVEKAMSPRRKDRPQTVEAFLSLLDAPAGSEVTVVPPKSKPEPKKSKVWLWALIVCAAVAAIITAIVLGGRKENLGVEDLTPLVDTTVIAPSVEQSLTTDSKHEIKPEPTAAGSIKVSSTPSGASIWLDGKNTKKTTPEIIDDITPGKHSVKLVLDGYNDYYGNITITSGKCADIIQTLKEKEKPVAVEDKTRSYYSSHESEILSDAQTAFISANYERAEKLCEWYYIIVGGNRADSLKKKATRCAELSARIRELKNAGKMDEARVFLKELLVLNPDDLLANELNNPGILKITSTPSGATIWLNGNNTNKTTPAFLKDLIPGNYSIRLVLDGYDDCKETITISSGNRTDLTQILILTLKEKRKSGSINGHDWVDLGLSVNWATCNVGASSPSEYGSYFAWGETKPTIEYTWENYKFRVTGDDKDNVTFNKYNTYSKHGTVDKKKKLELSDDAARQNWGGSWRMPTVEELKELREECVWTWTTQGGQNGYRVTSKTNGNSIFLPAAGYRSGNVLYEAGTIGYYWSPSINTVNSYNAWNVRFTSDGVYRSDSYRRYLGFSVRPVTE